MGRVISSFVYNVSCTYTRVDIVKHIQTRISGSCTGEQMEEVYKSTLFLSRILFQKHHIHSGLQRTTSLGYPPQLPHRRRQDIHLFIHSFIHPPATTQQEVEYSLFIYQFINPFIHLPIHPLQLLHRRRQDIHSYFHSSFHLPIPPSFYPFILSFFLLSFYVSFHSFIQSSFRLFFTFFRPLFIA